METENPQDAATPATVKQTVAREILSLQRIILYSILAGIIVGLFCLFLFNPYKFDNEKYKKVTGITAYSIDLNTPIYSPYWWSEGFFDYCDSKVGFNPYFPQLCYAERKEYLIWKAVRFGFYTFIISMAGILIFRYGTRGQKWLVQNSK